MYFLIIAISIVVILFLASYISFYMAFYVPKRKAPTDEFQFPEGAVYEPHHEKMLSFMKETESNEELTKKMLKYYKN